MRSDPSRLVTALWAARSHAGPLLAAGGVVLEVIGWFCVSGESLTARQLPYIASASIPGAALIVSGAVLTAGRHPAGDETARQVAELHALLVEYAPDDGGAQVAPAGAAGQARGAGPAGASAEGAADANGPGAGPVAVPDGTTFHDPACGLVAGKSPARVTGEQIAARGLSPCPVCGPDPG